MEEGMTTVLKIQETRGNEQILEETHLSRNANRKVNGKWCKRIKNSIVNKLILNRVKAYGMNLKVKMMKQEKENCIDRRKNETL